MSKYSVRVTEVSNTTVRGTCDGKTWEAAPFHWGGKTLMKVTDEYRAQFGQGEKVVIGQAAKEALRKAETALPPAPEGKRRTSSQPARAESAAADRIAALEAQLAELTAFMAANLQLHEGPDEAPAE